MAIAFDKSGSNSGTNTITVALAAAAANEMAILFSIGDAGTTVPTVTVGGIPATQIGPTYIGYAARVLTAWYFENPPTASTNYVFDRNANPVGTYNPVVAVLLYSGAGVPNANAQNTAASSNLTLTVSVPTVNSWLASCYNTSGAGVNSNAGGAGTTQRENIASDSAGDSNGAVGTGDQSMAWTGGRTTSGGFIVAIPPSGGGGVISHFMNLLGVGT